MTLLWKVRGVLVGVCDVAALVSPPDRVGSREIRQSAVAVGNRRRNRHPQRAALSNSMPVAAKTTGSTSRP